MENRFGNRITDTLRPGEVRRVRGWRRGYVQCLSGVLWITGWGWGDILLRPGECADLGRLKRPCLGALGDESVVYRTGSRKPEPLSGRQSVGQSRGKRIIGLSRAATIS